MAKLTLWLTAADGIYLEKTAFSHPALEGELKSVRGKTAGAFKGYSTFQWTQAVQSMVILTLRTVADGIARGKTKDMPQDNVSETNDSATIIQGLNGTPASSLDYSIGKIPVWLLDIFGVDRSGTPLAKRLFNRTNPERKRSGPVAVAINPNILPHSDITVYIDQQRVEDPKILLEMAESIEESFRLQRRSKSVRQEDRTATVSDIRDASSSFKVKGSVTGVSKQVEEDRTISCPCCGESLGISLLTYQAA